VRPETSSERGDDCWRCDHGHVTADQVGRQLRGGEPTLARTRTQKAKSGVDRIGLSGADLFSPW
jgi:hypothetical protein